MADLAVDPAPFLTPEAEDPNGPLIPMVVSLTFPGMDRGAHDLQDEFTRIAFAAVREAGGRPRLVDSAAERLAASDEVFADARGIVFLGGGDVDVACYAYDGPVPANLYGVDRRGDDYCLDLIRESVRRDLPTLAICRGSQLLNVAFGGTLIPDIADWEMHHGGVGEPLFIDERVRLQPGSEIARILGRTDVTVRNGHHQAVAEVAPALRATARAHDGIVEGTEHREASWVLGVQWHPEEPQADTQDRARLFEALVARARG
ncbi:gamma-glutamyl-gamma-aminobutyrate hydrolase family protein [Leucobacter triazinivorans]|uniref:Gamma-glutamyl-gamma-aminobutyrate hydrolase family protein n=1 Tax=Leucobacter triazinivorans TaxID=1784719 RepID=A0A4P6KCZ0_9MICO|nr:gamma-glutamyl-gamma-aminobutyrate hydrolase family protein [Leucobacter triazinivorans]QBE48013.1 gamma-glutamyl-gamma-aminobutyrate hydrolase family protein [Leucobacter triazinivorans]